MLLEVANLVDIAAKPCPHVLGHVVGVELAVVAVAENLVGLVVGSHHYVALTRSTIKYIETLLAVGGTAGIGKLQLGGSLLCSTRLVDRLAKEALCDFQRLRLCDVLGLRAKACRKEKCNKRKLSHIATNVSYYPTAKI